MSDKRVYRMSTRARAQDETRQRIVDATMRLHEEIGPRATTISAIAERAGVQRLTVYRHFPDENAVFQACTSHWLSLNPPPDSDVWRSIRDPEERLSAALAAFYGYYAATRRMWAAAHRDVTEVPALQGPMAGFAAFVASAADALTDDFRAGPERTPRILVTIRHALGFPTWMDLEESGLDTPAKVALVLGWIEGVRKRPERQKSWSPPAATP